MLDLLGIVIVLSLVTFVVMVAKIWFLDKEPLVIAGKTFGPPPKTDTYKELENHFDQVAMTSRTLSNEN